VSLYFAEIFHTLVGQRVFNVFVNGVEEVNSLDIVDVVGADAALILVYTVTTSGSVIVKLEKDAFRSVENPQINALSIVRV
jgi:hypothetical protein